MSDDFGGGEFSSPGDEVTAILNRLRSRNLTPGQAIIALRRIGVEPTTAQAVVNNAVENMPEDGGKIDLDLGAYPEQLEDVIEGTQEQSAFGGSGRRPAVRSAGRRRAGDEPGPDPNGTSAEIIDELWEMPPGLAAAWIRNNVGSLDDATADDIDAWAAQRMDEADDDSDLEQVWSTAVSVSEPAANEASDEAATEAANAQAEEEAAGGIQTAAQEIFEANPGQPVDLTSLSAMLPEHLEPGTPEANTWLMENVEVGRENAIEAEAQAQQGAGVDEATARELAEETHSQGFLDNEIPRWLLQKLSDAGALGADGQISEAVQQRMLDYYNDTFNGTYTDFDQLVSEVFQEPTEINVFLAESAVLANEPVIAFDIEIPFVRGSKGDRSVHLTQDEVEALHEYGFSTDGITRLVRMANLFPGFDPNTGENRTPDLSGVAAIASALGIGDDVESFQARQQQIELLEAQIAELGPAMSPAAESYEAKLRGQLESLKRSQGIREEKGSLPSYFAAQNRYNRGLDKYGDNQTLAFIYAMDEGLAERIVASGNDPEKLSLEDSEAATQLLMDGGIIDRSSTKAGRLGMRSGDNVLRQFQDYFGATTGGGGGGGAGKVRRLVDDVAVKEQVQRLWQAMFRAEADDSLIAAFTANLQGQLDAAPEGMEFDVSSRIQQWLKGQAVYGELYGKKPPGVTEEEYQQQFLAAQQSILGNEISDDDSIKAGMKTGQYQTTVGASAFGAKAQDNSRWMERIARAANVVAETT